MMIHMKLVLLILILAVVLQFLELRRFRITTYEITSKKLKEPCEILFLSDLHGKIFGGRLIRNLRKLSPDYILVGGDVISKKNPKEMVYMPEFLQQLTEIAPVFYGFGNHETTIEGVLSHEMPDYDRLWNEYSEKVKNAGIKVIRNDSIQLRTDITAAFLELPESFYRKFETVDMTDEDIRSLIVDTPDEQETFQILLAHNPAYSEHYCCLNPDLILSGHTHGGLIRFPFVGSLISTELTFNPKYDGGRYRLTKENGEECMLIVSKGLGTHSYPIRIMDRAEAVRVILRPEN